MKPHHDELPPGDVPLSDEELDAIVKPSKSMENHLLTWVDDKQEMLGALQRRGMTKGEAAMFWMLSMMNNTLDRIELILSSDEPDDGDMPDTPMPE